MHPVVDEIIKDNFGCLPRKVSSSEYNRQIKIVCQLCEIDNMVFGKVFNQKSKRKVLKYYKKYELITSHTARKSFLTNNYDKMDDQTINSVLGWSKKSKMATKYNQTSKLEYAEKLKEKWNS